MAHINRTQWLVLAFFLTVWLALLVILATSPGIYGRTLRLGSAEDEWVEEVFVAAISAFIALLSIGVLKRWVWVFWLILVAFLVGLLRIPVATLQLTGHLEAEGPTWYVVFQGALGFIQFLIGIAMLVGYRKGGRWGAF